MYKTSLKKLLDVFHNMVGRVKYGLGDKAPSLNCDSSDIDNIDCSGFVRYALAKASDQKNILPDGSFYQREFCEKAGLHKVRYEDLQYTVNDATRLFVGYIVASSEHPIGHTWLIHKGKTLESCGSHGVSSRPWNSPILYYNVSECFELPLDYDIEKENAS